MNFTPARKFQESHIFTGDNKNKYDLIFHYLALHISCKMITCTISISVIWFLVFAKDIASNIKAEGMECITVHFLAKKESPKIIFPLD